MNNMDDIFWLALWILVAIVIVMVIRGCNVMVVEENRHAEAMADRGYEYHSHGWYRYAPTGE